MKLKPEKKITYKHDGIILCTFYYVFRVLSYISLFSLVRLILGDLVQKCAYFFKHPNASKQEYKDFRNVRLNPFFYSSLFSEIWVIFNLIMSITASLIMTPHLNPSLSIALCVYAVWRSFDIFVYQVNVLLFDPIRVGRDQYRIKSTTRMILMLIINFAEYIFWFSTIYLFVSISNCQDITYVHIISFNIFTNISNIHNLPDFEKLLIIGHIESIIGLFMNLVCLARFISMLPPVKSLKDE